LGRESAASIIFCRRGSVLCLEGEMGLPTVPMTVSLGWNEGPIWYTHVAPERTRWQSVGIARSAVTTSASG
jgi:hypothetical protein